MANKTIASDRRRRKMITALWILIFTVGVIVLIYREMTAVLYILATLGVTVLLLVVAFADLSHVSGTTDQSNQNDASTLAK